MKQGVIYLLILIGGIGIGYVFNHFFNLPSETSTEIKTVFVEKINKQIVRDTVEIEKFISLPSNSDSILTSETSDYNDSLTFDELNIENIPSEDVEEVIIKEELISQRTISLEALPNDSTDVAKLLEMKSNAFSNDLIVEFWQSPLNITGYELSRNKLKLFGFNPNESISLQIGNEEDQLFLNTDSMSLLLQKTKQFKTLKLK